MGTFVLPAKRGQIPVVPHPRTARRPRGLPRAGRGPRRCRRPARSCSKGLFY